LPLSIILYFSAICAAAFLPITVSEAEFIKITSFLPVAGLYVVAQPERAITRVIRGKNFKSFIRIVPGIYIYNRNSVQIVRDTVLFSIGTVV